MKPGRELDALVAEKVMGFHRASDGWFRTETHPGGVITAAVGHIDLPHYSINISAAWEVVEKLLETGSFSIYHYISAPESKWRAQFLRAGSAHVAQAESAPRAICLAALKAFGIPHTPA